MKQTFSPHWTASSQPRKQRKFRYNAPLHIKSHFLHVHLSKDLRSKHNTRALSVRAGDEVKVMRGQFTGKSGKVERVDTQRTKIYVAGVEGMKRDGTKRPYPMQASNLMITKLSDDKRRLPVTAKPVKANAPRVPTGKGNSALKEKTAKASKPKAEKTDTKPAKAKAAKK